MRDKGSNTGAAAQQLCRSSKLRLLKVEQAAPYAPLEIKRNDVDTESVAGVLAHPSTTGKLILNGDQSAQRTRLFQSNQLLVTGDIMAAFLG
jgi:hypothetical protein